MKEKCIKKHSVTKVVCRIVAIVFTAIVFTAFIPIKFCIMSIPKNDKEFYIINQSTKSIIGDNNGFYDDDIRRELFVPKYI